MNITLQNPTLDDLAGAYESLSGFVTSQRKYDRILKLMSHHEYGKATINRFEIAWVYNGDRAIATDFVSSINFNFLPPYVMPLKVAVLMGSNTDVNTDLIAYFSDYSVANEAASALCRLEGDQPDDIPTYFVVDFDPEIHNDGYEQGINLGRLAAISQEQTWVGNVVLDSPSSVKLLVI